MTYAEAIQFLYSLRMFGTKLGLENTLKLAALAGNPQERLRFIHVAGTNGKGSTCAMLESIYRAAGLRVGLFTSPPLVSFAERIQANRKPISDEDLVRLVGELQPLLKHFPDEAHPTFFEVVTIMALRYFAERQCELVILETGLGGRLDATNIVTPLASVITSIALDHEKWLGSHLQKIALEKAGIIKSGKPVITCARSEQGLEEIYTTAQQRNAPLTRIDSKDAKRPPLNNISLPLAGEFQKLNAALALAVVRSLDTNLPVSETAMLDGLLRVQWAGRLQVIRRPGGQVILLDGAHNPAGAEMLCAEAQRLLPAKPALILGILADKDWETMGRLLAPIAGRVLLTPIQSERSLLPEKLRTVAQKANAEAEIVICSSLADALDQVQDEPAIIITGSLYLVGEALELLA